MVWFRVDDSLPDHPKTLAIQSHKSWKGALALWTLAGAWCGKHLTNGNVPRSIVSRLGGTASEVAALVEHGFWEETDTGFIFHDWESRNPTRESVEAARAKTRQRVAKHEAKAKQETVPNGATDASANSVPNASANGVSDGVRNAPPFPTLPDPTDPKSAARSCDAAAVAAFFAPGAESGPPPNYAPEAAVWDAWLLAAHNGKKSGSAKRQTVCDILGILADRGLGTDTLAEHITDWLAGRTSSAAPTLEWFRDDLAGRLDGKPRRARGAPIPVSSHAEFAAESSDLDAAIAAASRQEAQRAKA